ncbi:TyrR/PhhR family helix-turn-helix DNA-binding protein [Microbulbifer sp. 2205BS26-8]|uniref:TyrR/PhhR family helix-turn-helix DNA-binding protein n=1 Tax=Microbulbifer sp. 2205BS26-8 TaxID=3064386 RepID=UPI00273EA789|nr:TyrR/PhhR family helix-turn-helix DNA-binding protein [Microbulbifer sp. 2205BS26-8]MDP5208886.1 sigma 54-interacting transcriptional regulator [Microbulbifer sp. 2205BS26-8]
MEIFGEYRINVTSGELGGDSGDKVYLLAPGMLSTQYQSIERSLYRVPGVQRVRRITLLPLERRYFELDTLLRHVTDPILSVDREGRVVAANLAAARVFGVSLDRVPGMQLQRFLPLMQVAELLRDFSVPRYGLQAVVRGQNFYLNWSPIALGENPSGVDSMAGAVLRLQAREKSAFIPQPLRAMALWDFDLRRQRCLQLRDLAALTAPLLIAGERGTGKSTFASAVHYLSPSAARSGCIRIVPCEGRFVLPTHLHSTGTLILEDVHHLSEKAQIGLRRQLRELPAGVRLVATCGDVHTLAPALAQVFSSLAITLPPLRKMRPALERFATTLLRQEYPDLDALDLDESVQDLIRRHDWPENFHGLRDYLMAAAAHCRRRGTCRIDRQDVPELIPQTLLPWRNWGRGLTYREIMEQLERAVFGDLAASRLSTRELAKELGISHTTVANKLRKYGLSMQKK